MEKDEKTFSWLDLIKAFWFFSEGHRFSLLFWTILLFIVSFYSLVPPILIGKTVDFFIKYKAGESLNPFYFYVLTLGITSGITSALRLYSKNRISQIGFAIRYLARVKGFERLIDFSLRWHDSENTGNKVQRIQTGTSLLFKGLSIMKNDLFMVITSVAGVLAAFWVINILYGLLFLVYLAGFIFIQLYFYRKMLKLSNEKYKATESASGTYYEGLNNVLTIKTLGAQATFKKSIIDKELISKTFDSKLATLATIKWQIFQVFSSISFIAFLLMTGHSVLTGLISIGTILIIYNYLNNLFEATGRSMNLVDDLVDVKTGIARMMPIYWEKEEEDGGKLRFPTQWDNLTIENGLFDYKNHTIEAKTDGKLKVAIKNLNFKIEKNQKIGVVGRSGSGKSTLAKLLMGLYRLDEGEYKVGNSNFYEIKHSDITDHMTLVLQDSEMFNLSLKDNITLLKSIDPKLFNIAIETSQLSDLIEKLPDGLDTLIGEKGYRLSGGERQRIGLARAICKNPQILILDESTSSLDSKTESLVQEGLEKNLDSKTMIIIAHRISTLKNVDKIYVFENGEIVEEGSFEKLTKDKDSKFNEIYKSQSQ